MRKIKRIIIHCSATQPSLDVGVAWIDELHRNRGWREIGYHHVIRRDGTLEKGRDEAVVGAHAKGHNTDSIGICLMGGIDSTGKPEFNYTHQQMENLEFLVRSLQDKYGTLTVLGHRDLPGVMKACPCFSVRKYFTA